MTEFTYLSVGHPESYQDDEVSYGAWLLPSGYDDLVVSWFDADHLHGSWEGHVDCRGRIDPQSRTISISNVGCYGDESRVGYAVSLLLLDYPSYDIWRFGYGQPRKYPWSW